MLSTRAVLALFYMLLFGIVIVTSAPNRILMRFGKRTIATPADFHAVLPSDYFPLEELGLVLIHYFVSPETQEGLHY